jgi:hypothetical protein
VAGNGGLADALARSDHRQGRQLERLEAHGIEAEVGAEVGKTRRQRAARELETAPRIDDRLVGEIDHGLGACRLDAFFQGVVQGNAVVLVAAQLLGAADENGAQDLVRQRDERHANDVRVVLAVNQGQTLHLLLTSSSIRVVYFSNSSVSAEN